MRYSLFLLLTHIILSNKVFSQNCLLANAGPDKQICTPGGSVILGTPTVAGATYFWDPAIGLNNPNIAQPVASPSTTTTYTLTVVSGQNLLVNGDFEFGLTGFNSDYGLYPIGDGLCGGGPEQFGSITVSPNPNSVYTNWCTKTDHSATGNRMLVVDGSCGTNRRVWFQTVAIAQNTNYSFYGWASPNSYDFQQQSYVPLLRVRINGVDVIQNFAVPWGNVGCTNWQQFSTTWNSGTATNALIEIIDDNLSMGGNDFSLDDLFFNTCPSSTDQVTVCVCTPPPPPSTVTRDIPLNRPFQMFKYSRDWGQYCYDPTRNGTHGHSEYYNYCRNEFIMSGYMKADNNLPSYQAVDLAFNMFPRNFGAGPILYLPSYGNYTQDEFIPVSDISLAMMSLTHYSANYPICANNYYQLNEFGLSQCHNGDNSFTVTRSSHKIDIGSCSGSYNGPQNYDNPPLTYPSDVIIVPSTTNPNQDFLVDVTQMVKNGVNNFANQNYLGFQLKQVQTSTYNNVLFQGNIFSPTGIHPLPGEPFIRLTYISRPPGNNCINYKPGITTQPTNKNTFSVKQYDTLTSKKTIVSNIKIIPNPSSTQLTILSNNKIKFIEIYNLSGSLLKHKIIENLKSINFSVTDLQSGYYLAKVSTDQGVEYIRFIVQR